MPQRRRGTCASAELSESELVLYESELVKGDVRRRGCAGHILHQAHHVRCTRPGCLWAGQPKKGGR